LFSRKLW